MARKAKTKNSAAPQAYKPDNDPRIFRTAAISIETRELEDGKTEAVVRASVSSEEPYERYMCDENGERVRAYEVLGHKDGEIDFSRMKDGLVIQDTHWGDQIGIIREPEVKDGKLGGVIEFGSGERSQEIARDAAKGIRRNMSVGYIVNKYKRDGVAEDGLPIFRVVDWTPYEASFVNVPADASIGVGRVLDTTEGGAEPETRAAVNPSAVQKKEEKEMDAKTIAALMAKAERAHMKAADVSALIEQGKTEAEISDAIAERALKYADEVQQKAEKEAAERAAKKPNMPAPAAPTIIAGGEGKGRKYNLVNVIRSMVAAHEGNVGPDIGFEREISQEIARQNHKSAKGLFVPSYALLTGKRALDTSNAAGLVATDTLFGEFIQALVADTVLGRVGVRTIEGLVGDVAIPKGSAAQAYWITPEGGNATQTTPGVGQVAATPHTVGAYTDITRKLLIQNGISSQNLVADELRGAIARAVEAAVFSGTGANGQPTGLDNFTEVIGGETVGIPTVSMTAGAPTHANMVEFWSKIYSANANGERMSFIGSPAVKALLRSTRDVTVIKNEAGTDNVAAVGTDYLCDADSRVEGYEFHMSNLCNSKKLYFGDWREIMLAFWSGIDLTVDTASLSLSGGVRVVALQDCDVV
ncbi:MAG: phage major capsid protein, partial [Kiritimatiellae bacterium]|nr:phage major capsid protein [Kiritimatiellia bacterium]